MKYGKREELLRLYGPSAFGGGRWGKGLGFFERIRALARWYVPLFKAHYTPDELVWVGRIKDLRHKQMVRSAIETGPHTVIGLWQRRQGK